MNTSSDIQVTKSHPIQPRFHHLLLNLRYLSHIGISRHVGSPGPWSQKIKQYPLSARPIGSPWHPASYSYPEVCCTNAYHTLSYGEYGLLTTKDSRSWGEL